MLFNLHRFQCFWVFPLKLVSSFSPLCSEKMLDMISISLNLLRLVLCLLMSSIFENVPCVLENNVYFASLGWKALYMSVNSFWSKALFNATISLLIFCLEDLSIFDSGVLKSPIAVNIFLEVLQDFFYVFEFWCWVQIHLPC